MSHSIGHSTTAAGPRWRLRLWVVLTLIVTFVAARLTNVLYVASGSSNVASVMDSVAVAAGPILPAGGVDVWRLNPSGLRSPFDEPLMGSEGAGVAALDAGGRPIGFWAMALPLANGLGYGRMWLAFLVWPATAVAVTWMVGRPRVVSGSADSRRYALRVWCTLVLWSLPPGALLLWSVFPARAFWGAAWYRAGGWAWIDMSPFSAAGPALGAAVAYAVTLGWFTRVLALRAARRDRLATSAGRVAGSDKCLTCGYATGDVTPCPECGAPDPRAFPEGVCLGRLHARLVASRWRLAAPIVLGAAVAAGYALPLVVGVVRVLWMKAFG